MTFAPAEIAPPTPGLLNSTTSRLSSIGRLLVSTRGGVTPTSSAFPSANRCLYQPFEIEVGDTINKFWWANGATVGTNNVQCAVYRDDFTQLLLGNSTLSAGATRVQFDDVTDTWIAPGRYYMAIACNGTTATFYTHSTTAAFAKMMGMYQQATAFPPPDPMVPVASASNPIACGIQFRTSV